MSEAEKIAAKLTEAQRAWLLAAEPTLDNVVKEPCAEWWDHPPLHVGIDGVDHWLGSKGMTSPEGCSTFTDGWERLTPLGLEVRKVLSTRTKDGSDHA